MILINLKMGGTGGDGFSCTLKRVGIDEYLFITKRKVSLKHLLNDICLQYDIEQNDDNLIQLQKTIKSRIESYVKRDEKYHVNNTIGYKDFCELLRNNNVCYYCNTIVKIYFGETYKEDKMTLDARIPKNGHNKNNVCICCHKCNSLKSESTDIDFKQKCKNEQKKENCFIFVSG